MSFINIRPPPISTITILLAILAVTTLGLPPNDKVDAAPGFIDQVVYSGYLKSTIANRQIHYIFIGAQQHPQAAPLTVWFNGGPGCSSLIGLLQQIGPYLVGNTYKHGQSLTRNDYAWNKISNLLFLESPALVGFSTDVDHGHVYTDKQTADDAFAALKDFLFEKAPEFEARDLYLSGESYAGKYVPDIAYRMLQNNEKTDMKKINLKGILIGNGVMSFEHESLTISQMQFLGQHDFLSHRLVQIAEQSCFVDFESPRCKYFQYEFRKIRHTLNVYNIFEVCQEGKGMQAVQMNKILEQQPFYSLKPSFLEERQNQQLKEVVECFSDNGAISYWNEYKVNYHVDKSNKTWSPCTGINYQISQRGSMDEYYEIFTSRKIKVWLFSGDWDDQVPFPDTEKNLMKLGKRIHENWKPWFIRDDQHAGFFYNEGEEGQSFSLITVKTASHMVPQSRPMEAYQMFYNFIHGRSVNTTIPWW